MTMRVCYVHIFFLVVVGMLLPEPLLFAENSNPIRVAELVRTLSSREKTAEDRRRAEVELLRRCRPQRQRGGDRNEC